MASWLFAPPAERRLLAGGGRFGATTWLIAIMTFAMVVVGAAGLALANAAAVVTRGVEHRYALQLPDGERLAAAAASARAAPGVTGAEAVPETEMRRTLERWLGPAGLGDDLPVPALVTLDVAPGADTGAIRRTVEQAVPGARFVAHRETLAPLLRSLRTVQWLALSLVVLIAAATAAAVVLAARGALDTHRFTIDVMHGIGATDEQVTRLFQRSIALDALSGALLGGSAAAVGLAIVAGGGAALAGELAGTPPLGTRDLLILAALPLATVALATWVARLTVLAALRRSL